MKIICITTGTKFIYNNNHRIYNGELLNDCHAEIIARRCIIRYCYQQLKLLIEENNSESIFERIQNSSWYYPMLLISVNSQQEPSN